MLLAAVHPESSCGCPCRNMQGTKEKKATTSHGEMPGVAAACKRRLQGASRIWTDTMDKDPLVAGRGSSVWLVQKPVSSWVLSLWSREAPPGVVSSRGHVFLSAPSHRPALPDHCHMPQCCFQQLLFRLK